MFDMDINMLILFGIYMYLICMFTHIMQVLHELVFYIENGISGSFRSVC